jgi:hypothetical protein
MFRSLHLRFSRNPNCTVRSGYLIASQDIRRGDRIRIPAPKLIYRTKKERREVDRLADVSYSHAINN